MASAYRYGNDIRVYWTIIDSEGQPYNLEGRDLRLWMKNGTRKFEVTDYHVAGNIITWVYYGKNQSNCFLGTFEAILCENCGEIGMATLDTQDVFRLVSRSKDSSAGDGVRVRTEAVVNIQSQLTSSVQQLCITKEEYEDIFGVGSATHGGSAMETPDVLASLKDYIDKENIEDIYVLDTYPSVGTVYSEDVFDAMATSKAVAISGDDAILGRAVHFDGGSYLSFLKITSDDKSGVVVVATLSHGEDEYTVTALTETVVVDRVYLEQNFLSIADAAATYLSKAVAAATYLKITDAAVQYVAKTGGVFTGPVSFSGGISATGASLSGEANMNNNRIRNVASPVNDADAANKGWVVALIGSIQQFHYEVYPSLSDVTNPSGSVLYLIGPTGSGDDKYEEYVYDSSKTSPWIKIGDTSIDLSGYMPKSGGRFSGRVIFEDGASFEGSLSLDDVQIHGLADPTNLGDAANKRYVDNGLASKQDTLVSGSNIKTVNGATLLGSGNIKVKEAPQVVDTSVNKYLTFDWGSGVLMSLVTLKYLNGYRNLLLNLYPSGENHASVIDLDGAVNCLQDDTFEYSEGLGAGYFHLISSVTSATISIISGESGVVITAEAEPTYVDASAEIVPYLGTAVKYTAQSLTEAQKTQARENIGAMSAGNLPWRAEIGADEYSNYIAISLTDGDGCILAVDSVGENSFHGVLNISAVGDITAASFVGAGGIDTDEDVEIGDDGDGDRFVVLRFTTDQSVVITCLAGTAPISAESVASNPIVDEGGTLPWTELGAGGGSSDVFWATYGSTTYNEVIAANTAGKVVMCYYNNNIYQLQNIDSNSLFFSCRYAQLDFRQLTLSSGNVWGSSWRSVESSSNKKTDIASNRTSETYYPNTKGVFDLTSKWGVISQTQDWTLAADGGYDYTMSGQVYGIIPQANIDLFVAAGAEFDTATGYFKLNGLTDISYDEMAIIYNTGDLSGIINLNEFLAPNDPRTLIPFSINRSASQTMTSFEQYGELLESAVIIGNNSPRKFSGAFDGCRRLKRLIVPDVSKAESLWARNFNSLETCYFGQVTKDITDTFKISQRLSLASVVYIVDNAANTSAITITLHATAYARCQADTTEYTYQGNTYTGIIAYANARNITIASA